MFVLVVYVLQRLQKLEKMNLIRRSLTMINPLSPFLMKSLTLQRLPQLIRSNPLTLMNSCTILFPRLMMITPSPFLIKSQTLQRFQELEKMNLVKMNLTTINFLSPFPMKSSTLQRLLQLMKKILLSINPLTPINSLTIQLLRLTMINPK